MSENLTTLYKLIFQTKFKLLNEMLALKLRDL